MGVQDLTLPFIKKKDLEKKKEEMKQSIGMLSKQKGEGKLHELEVKAEVKKKEEKKGTQQLEVPEQEKKEKAQKEETKKGEEEKAVEKVAEVKAEDVTELPEIFKKPLPAFYFWYCDLKASSLLEFEEAVRKAPLESLQHHASNHDFSKWLEKNAPNSFIVKLRIAEEKSSDELRNAILEALEFLKKKEQNSKKEGAAPKEEEMPGQNPAKKELKEPLVASL
ncbi:MAG: hypothetical protein J7L44_01690 [Candidatus Diapherotrites archaeon]|nr:hypothetical protein [Candidatus Diapherotrites archaeon]